MYTDNRVNSCIDLPTIELPTIELSHVYRQHCSGSGNLVMNIEHARYRRTLGSNEQVEDIHKLRHAKWAEFLITNLRKLKPLITGGANHGITLDVSNFTTLSVHGISQ